MTNQKKSPKATKKRAPRANRPNRALNSLEVRHARLVNRVRVLEHLIGAKKLKDDPKFGPSREEEEEPLDEDHWETDD